VIAGPEASENGREDPRARHYAEPAKCRWRRVRCPSITAGGCPAGLTLRRLGGAGGPRRPLTRQGVPMAANSRTGVERAGDREKFPGDRAAPDRAGSSARARSCASARRRGPGRGDPDRFDRAGRGAGASGGLPRGRIVEIYGPGRPERQRWRCTLWPTRRRGRIAAFIDAEHALDPDYAKKLGCDTDALLVSQPDTG